MLLRSFAYSSNVRLGQSALILGATGAVGRNLLAELLASPHFTKVGEYGRRVTSQERLARAEGRSKLEQKVIDFERLEEAGLGDGKWDVVFITYGRLRSSQREHKILIYSWQDLVLRGRMRGV